MLLIVIHNIFTSRSVFILFEILIDPVLKAQSLLTSNDIVLHHSGGISLLGIKILPALWLFCLLIKNQRVKKKIIFVLCAFWVLLALSTTINSVDGTLFSFRSISRDMFDFVNFTIIILILGRLSLDDKILDKEIPKIGLYALILYFAFGSVYFTIPLSMPLTIFFAYYLMFEFKLKKSSIHNLQFLPFALPSSRNVLLVYLVFFITRCFQSLVSIRLFVKILISTLFFLFAINILIKNFGDHELINSYLDLVSFKLRFFVFEIFNGLSHSPAVRLNEFYSIINNASVIELFIGSGLAGSAPFGDFYKLTYTIDDYSALELMKNYFYRPHTVINLLLLKVGMLGIFLYTFTLWVVFLKYADTVKGLIYFPIIWYFGFIFPNVILILLIQNTKYD